MLNFKSALNIIMIARCVSLCYGVECKHSTKQVLSRQVFSVVGSGNTSMKAFKDAKNRLPAGKSYFKVMTKKSGKIFYVTLYYR